MANGHSYGLDDFKSLCRNGLLHEAIQAAGYMLSRGIQVPSRAFHIIVQACVRKTNLEYGRLSLGLIVKYSIDLDTFLGSQFIRMFTLCNSLPEANQVFYHLPKANKFAWSAIILANATLGQGRKAVELYHQMQQSGLEPDGHVFVAALKGCASIGDLLEGKQIETDIRQGAFKVDTIVGNALIGMYVKCGSLEDAFRVFHGLPNQDIITWNTLMAGYTFHGHNEKAFNLFAQMLWKRIQPDPATFISVLKACDKPKYLNEGKHFHACVVENGIELNVRVGNSLICMYALCGSLQHACIVFDTLPKSGVVTWNAMISAYIEQKRPLKAFLVFQLMQQKGMQPNRVTFLCILKACVDISSIDLGKQLHCNTIESHLDTDSSICNALIDMYAKCGGIGEAAWVFSRLSKQGIITWNALISGFIQHGQACKALDFFNQMLQSDVQPDPVTFVSISRACSPSFTDTFRGFEMHTLIIFSGYEGEIIVGNSVIDMYTRNGSLKDARRVFDRLLKRDTVSWNTMMTGYAEHLCNQEVSALFHQMQSDGGEPDRATFLSLLKVCSDTSTIDQVNVLLDLLVKSGFESDEVIQSTLVHMYVKCGNLKDARCVSSRLHNRDLVTWNALIAGYAQRGNSKAVQQLFKSMQIEGVQPDDVTILSLLTTVSHVGSLEEGILLFRRVQEEYGLVPTLDHFNCLVDLLGRAGRLEEAQDLLQSMPPVPNVVGWTSLLGHCKTYANLDVGTQCYINFVALDKEDATGYVLMWKIFSQFWMEEGAERAEELLRQVEALKMSRKACIE